MKVASEFERDLIKMVHSLPLDTVVILGNVKGMKLHQVLRGEQILGVVEEAIEVKGVFEHDSDDNK